MPAMTTPEYLMFNSNNHADEKAISTKNERGDWNHLSWRDFHDQTASVAKSLIAVGFEEGDKLSIYSYNRIEWYNSYHAANIAKCNRIANSDFRRGGLLTRKALSPSLHPEAPLAPVTKGARHRH